MHVWLRKACLIVAIVILAAGMLPGCSAQAPSSPTAAQQPAMRTITDLKGKSVTIPSPDKIERFAVLTSPIVQISYIIGVQDKLCAMTQSQKRFTLFEKFYPRQAEIPAPRAQAGDVNVEALLKTNPQFCIGSEVDMDVVDKNTDIPTIRIDTSVPDDVFEERRMEVRMFGTVFGREDRAENYCQLLDDVLARIKQRTADLADDKKAKVFLGFDPDHLTTYGGDTYMQQQIVAAGCQNAAEGISTIGGREGGLAKVSLEKVLSWNPDVIVIDNFNLEQMREDPVWASVSAVEKGNVFRLPIGGFIWNRPSSEAAVLFPIWLAHKAYPERFSDVTIEDEVRRYWKDVMGFELSDEDVDSILNP